MLARRSLSEGGEKWKLKMENVAAQRRPRILRGNSSGEDGWTIKKKIINSILPSKLKKVPYHIYVIELSKKVFTEHKKFREANPQFNGVLECLYVGMTSKSPKERFQQHKTGYRNRKGHNLSSSIVKKYGMYLRPSLYNHIRPLKNREEALKMEAKIALELRRKRYAVWYNW